MFRALRGRIAALTFSSVVDAGEEHFDLYISPTGNDTTGDGTLGNPYLTFAKAILEAGTGDKIGVTDGTYRQRGIDVSKAVTIKAVSGASPKIIPTTEYTSWAKTAGQTNVYETAVVGYASACYNGTTKLASVADVATCDSTTNSFYWDDPGDKVYVNIGGGAPTAIEIAVGATGATVTISADGAVFQGIELDYTALWPNITISGTGNYVLSCTFRSFIGYVNITGNGNTIGYNTLYSVNSGIAAYSANNVIIGNILSDCITGITVTGESRAATGNVVAYNTVTNSYNAIVITNAGAATVRYNTVIDSQHGGIFTLNASTTSIVHHNILYSATLDAAVYNWGIIVENGAQSEIYNNTVANLKNRGGIVDVGIIVLLGGAYAVVENNIFYNCKTGISISTPAGTADCDYNCVYGNDTNYQGTGAQGANDVNADPLFVDGSGHNYQLQAGSPCIGAGVTIAGISEASPATIGRYE